MKKSNFLELNRHLVGSLFTIYKHFGNFVECMLRFFCNFSMKIILYLIIVIKHRQAKVRRSLGICLYDLFIYRSNFVFQKVLETRRHLSFGRKTENSQR